MHFSLFMSQICSVAKSNEFFALIIISFRNFGLFALSHVFKVPNFLPVSLNGLNLARKHSENGDQSRETTNSVSDALLRCCVSTAK